MSPVGARGTVVCRRCAVLIRTERWQSDKQGLCHLVWRKAPSSVVGGRHTVCCLCAGDIQQEE